MKISELMERLGKIQGKEGDLEILTFDEDTKIVCQVSEIQTGFNVFSRDYDERAVLINVR